MDDSKFIIINHEVKEYRGLPEEETLIIPEGVKSIAPYVFSDRKHIKKIIFPESLLSIGEFAFVRCFGIKTLILPKGLKTIHTSAFSRCDNLETIKIPESVQSIGRNVFYNSVMIKRLKKESKDGFLIVDNCLLAYVGEDSKVTVPEGVRVIAGEAFKGSNITEIILPESLRNVCSEYGSFAECRSLKKVTAKTELIDVNANAFEGAPFLKELQNDFTLIGSLLIKCNAKEHIVLRDDIIGIGSFAFAEKGTFNDIPKEIYISKGIKHIAQEAFRDIALDKIIVDPDNEDFSVIDGVLYDNRKQAVVTHEHGHKKLIIREGTLEILAGAFRKDKSLESIELPEGMKNIGESAFEGCSCLAEIAIPEGVLKIESRTFAGCEELREIHIPDSVTELGADVFWGCENLMKLVAPRVHWISAWRDSMGKTTSSIIPMVLPHLYEFPRSEQTFNACRAIGYLQYPEYYNDPESIDKYQRYCITHIKELLSIILEKDNAVALQTYFSFRKVTAKTFEDVFLKPSMESGAVECTAFLMDWKHENIRGRKDKLSIEQLSNPVKQNKKPENADWIFKKAEDGSIIIRGYRGNDAHLVIPETINDKPVTLIEDSAFCKWTRTGKLKNEDRVDYYDNKMISVEIPSTVKEIGHSAFEFCGNLEKVIFRGNTEKIGRSAFRFCKKLNSISLPESLQIIENVAFEGCESLVTLQIPKKTRKLGRAAFSRCKNLESAVLPEGMQVVEYHMFSECRKLKRVTLPDSIRVIENGAFYKCSSLEKVTLPRSLKSIGESAFEGCTNLIINGGVDKSIEVGICAFTQCRKMADESKMVIVNGILHGYYGKKKEVIIPKGVNTITRDAFRNTQSPRKIIFPDTVVEIHDNSIFGIEKLEELYIPGSVRYISSHGWIRRPENLAIKTPEGSYAEEFARRHKIPVINGNI